MRDNPSRGRQEQADHMKLTAKEDIEAPLDFVFRAFADVEYWERAALRRGADVQRIGKSQSVAVGMGWNVGFEYRNKLRKLDVRLDELDRPIRMAFSGRAKSLEGLVDLEFLELGARRTRVTFTTELKPRTLTARLFLQSLKLAKARVTRRYDLRVGQLCNDIEDRYRVSTSR